jgi:hypothetical protein
VDKFRTKVKYLEDTNDKLVTDISAIKHNLFLIGLIAIVNTVVLTVIWLYVKGV